MNKEFLEGVVRRMKAKTKVIEDFVANEDYYDILESWREELEDKDSIQIDSVQDDVWNDSIQLMFDFMYSNANKVYHSVSNVVAVEYQGMFITLSEMHGQGCFQYIHVSYKEPPEYVRFDEIREYLLNDIKPMRYYTLDIVERGLMAVEAIDSNVVTVDGQIVHIDDVWEYLLKNLS